MNDINFGFLVIDKPTGLTSHDCVNRLRKLYKIKKIGHGGTLDPSVTGVLPIAIGKATKLLSFLPTSKKYEGTIQLGIITNTDDLEGEIINKQSIPNIEEKIINECINSFKGEIKQRPPSFSSVHINGERAYKKARRGEQFDLPTKQITIHKIELLQWNKMKGTIKLKIHCSSGTYIRSLARDIGNKLGCGGSLSKLRRIEALGFKINESISLEDFENSFPYIKSTIINPLKVLNYLPKVQLTLEEEMSFWSTGRPFIISQERVLLEEYITNKKFGSGTDFILVININHRLVGIGKLEHESYKIYPKIVFNAKG